MSEYTDKQSLMSEQKAQLEIDLEQAGKRLIQAEQERQAAMIEKKALETETSVFKKDMEDLDIAIQKLEQEKTNRDHTIRSLSDEISEQDEVINKLNKEKKHMSENSAKASEDLQVSE